MMEVADDAFDFAQRARSTGGTNDLHTVERDASGQLRKRASIKGSASIKAQEKAGTLHDNQAAKGHVKAQSYEPDERFCPICPKPVEGQEDTRTVCCIRAKTMAGPSNTAMAQHWKHHHTEAERVSYMAGRSYAECLSLCTERP